MGPFVPDIISDELNLIVALLLGIAFGAVLEQAGFSSSRRLAGVFYGYDFTVLRVFFTAGVTAMTGVILLGAFGLLDTDIIYINPTFIGPAIVGGLIMGVGFILGGYCPGTSLCAAAIGKKDGIAFIIGGIAGAFVFGELFPLYDVFYTSGSLGPIRIFNTLGISQGMFALALIAMAVAAFILTSRIEKKVDPDAPSKSFPAKYHIAAGAFLLLLGVVLVFIPDRKERMLAEIGDPAYKEAHPVKKMTSDELAFRLLDRDPGLLIIDLRPAQEFQEFTLPGAVNIPLDGLFGKEWSSLLGMRHRHRVFIDNDGSSAAVAALLAQRLGYEGTSALDGGLTGFRSTILAFQAPGEARSQEEADTYRFRAKASTALAAMIQESKAGAQKPKAPAKKIVGGC